MLNFDTISHLGIVYTTAEPLHVPAESHIRQQVDKALNHQGTGCFSHRLGTLKYTVRRRSSLQTKILWSVITGHLMLEMIPAVSMFYSFVSSVIGGNGGSQWKLSSQQVSFEPPEYFVQSITQSFSYHSILFFTPAWMMSSNFWDVDLLLCVCVCVCVGWRTMWLAWQVSFSADGEWQQAVYRLAGEQWHSDF